MEQMPLETPEELEQECLRLRRTNMMIRDIERAGIVPGHPSGTDQNWTYGEIYPAVKLRHLDGLLPPGRNP
jgi:hypothetical protein